MNTNEIPEPKKGRGRPKKEFRLISVQIFVNPKYKLEALEYFKTIAKEKYL